MSTIKRGPGGKFLKGFSANPGHKLKRISELHKWAQDETPASFELIKRVRDDVGEDAKLRVECAKFIVAYGLGLPPKLNLEALEAMDGDVVEPVAELNAEQLRAIAQHKLTSETPAHAPEPADAE